MSYTIDFNGTIKEALYFAQLPVSIEDEVSSDNSYIISLSPYLFENIDYSLNFVPCQLRSIDNTKLEDIRIIDEEDGTLQVERNVQSTYSIPLAFSLGEAVLDFDIASTVGACIDDNFNSLSETLSNIDPDETYLSKIEVQAIVDREFRDTISVSVEQALDDNSHLLEITNPDIIIREGINAPYISRTRVESNISILSLNNIYNKIPNVDDRYFILTGINLIRDFGTDVIRSFNVYATHFNLEIGYEFSTNVAEENLTSGLPLGIDLATAGLFLNNKTNSFASSSVNNNSPLNNSLAVKYNLLSDFTTLLKINAENQTSEFYRIEYANRFSDQVSTDFSHAIYTSEIRDISLQIRDFDLYELANVGDYRRMDLLFTSVNRISVANGESRYITTAPNVSNFELYEVSENFWTNSLNRASRLSFSRRLRTFDTS